MGKADLLIQGIRAKSYDPEKVALGIMAVVEEFFAERKMMLEPDCSQWVQDVNHDMEQFNTRCDAVMYCTSGDPRAAWHFIQPLNPQERVELLGELLDFFLYHLYMFKKEEEGVLFRDQLSWGEEWRSNPEGFLWSWNKYWDEDDCGFESRDEVIHHLCTSEEASDAGSRFVQVGDSCELDELFEIDREFHEFVTEVKGYKDFGCGGAIDTDDVNRSIINGGAGRVIDYNIPEVTKEDNLDVGFCYLTPFPGVRPDPDSSDRFKEICSDFNHVQSLKWLRKQHATV